MGAQVLPDSNIWNPADYGISGPLVNSRSAAVMDAETGTLLFVKNPDEEIPPASLTKLMTIHLALNQVLLGRISLDREINPPRESWAINQPPRSSLMFLADGQRTSLHELLLGLAVSSGNDAAVAVALCLAPSVKDFTDMMNREAATLGLQKARFDEPSGISEFNMTTAREFTQFCRIYIQNHPETLANYHSVPVFAYPKAENVAPVFRSRPGTIVQYNSNKLLGVVEGVDGLKTGYIDEAGYNIALTARRGDTRIIAVVLGAPLNGGEQIRNDDGQRLINWAFDNFKTLKLPEPDLNQLRIWKGKSEYVSVVPGFSVKDGLPFLTVPANRGPVLYQKTELTDPLIAPLPAGSIAGELIYFDNAGELYRVPLITAEEAEKGGFFIRLIDSIRLFFHWT